MKRWVELFRRRVRWLPLFLLLLGFVTELCLTVGAFTVNMDWLYLAILIAPLLFTPPPFLALLGAIVENRTLFRLLHIAVTLIGGVFAVVSLFMLSALAEKTARDYILRRMHGY